MYNVAFDPQSGKSPFEKISKTFLDDASLPFVGVLSAETIETVFRKHDGLFGGRFYNTVFVLWAFVLQTLSEYKGKETGESALLRKMLGSFAPDDVAVFDRYRCSYMMLALFQQHGVHVCTRINADRIVDFRKGKRLGEYDRLVVWKRPQRPEWMSKEVYETIPKTMELRMIRDSRTRARACWRTSSV